MTYDVHRWTGDEPDGWELWAEAVSAREAVLVVRQLERQGYDRDASILVERHESDLKVQKEFA